jgi:SAM-dependent methyltransferase
MKQADLVLERKNFSFKEDEDYLSSIVNGYMLSAVLFSAVRLRIFDTIKIGYCSSLELSKHLNLNVNAVERLLNALAHLRFLDRRDDDKYFLTRISAERLVANSSRSLVAAIMHHCNHAYLPFHFLDRSIATGKPYAGANDSRSNMDKDLYDNLSIDLEEYSIFLSAMNTFSKGVGDRIAKLIDFTNVEMLYDVGGGGGQVALELLRNFKDLKIVLFDRKESINFVSRDADFSLLQRLDLVEANILKGISSDVASSADIVLLSAVLGDWDFAHRSHILKSAWNLVKPGGRLVISETILDDDKSGSGGACLLSLYVLVLTQGGDNLTSEEWISFLKSNSIDDIEIIHDAKNGFRDLIVCRKPVKAI